MRLGYFAAACLSVAIPGIGVADAIAQDVVKIGVVIPMTGGFTSVGREVAAGAQLYIQQHGETVAGRKVELIIRDDAGVPDAGKRLAQELIVKDKVSFIGAGITPTAMAIAPLATEAKVATVVMVSGTSVVTERSPYYVRTSFTLGQQSGIIADWATQNGSKKAVAIISDWAPGAEASKVFDQHFTKGGGRVIDTLKISGRFLLSQFVLHLQ
jgi:branched-chain amino acid transport system substrate-binding protein